MKKSETILVVEDEEIYRSLLEQTLQDHGYQTVAAANGEEAMQLLEKIHVALIISDVRMPKMDGYAFYRRVREVPALQTIPFLFLTALADKNHTVKGLELGVDDYITKPIDVDSLLAVIRGKLKQATLLQQRVEGEVSKLKEEILRTLTQEFKTPLNIITGVSTFLLNENLSFDTTELKNLLASIKRGGTQLSHLVDDFVTAMNIDTGQMGQLYEVQKSPEELLPIVQDAIESVEKTAEERNVTIERDFGEGLPSTVVDRAQVRDMIVHLLQFCVTAAPAGSAVGVKAWYERGLLSLQVRCSGKAIPPNMLENVFKKFFYHGDTDTSTGLGLYIAKRLSEINKCDLSCISDEMQGTVFTVTFPQ